MSGECSSIASYFVIHDRILVHMNTSTPLPPSPPYTLTVISWRSALLVEVTGALSHIVESGIKHHNPNPSPMQ